MNDLERLALMGDKQAQEECTKQGIILSCPICKGIGALHSTNNLLTIYAVCQNCGVTTREHKDAESAINQWNTRPEFQNSHTTVKKTCHNCKHWERFCGYCCNKNSKYCSKFVDDGCDKWEMIDINTFKKW